MTSHLEFNHSFCFRHGSVRVLVKAFCNFILLYSHNLTFVTFCLFLADSPLPSYDLVRGYFKLFCIYLMISVCLFIGSWIEHSKLLFITKFILFICETNAQLWRFNLIFLWFSRFCITSLSNNTTALALSFAQFYNISSFKRFFLFC